MPKCIYCLEDKDVSLFNREHVLPVSSGSFKGGLTLINKVCSNCNQKFGDELDIQLARNTFEGVNRYKHGVKNPKNFKSMGDNSNFTIKVGEGQLAGLLVKLIPNQNGSAIVIVPIPQIGLRKIDETYDFFEFDKIPEFYTINKKYPNSEKLILIPPGVDKDAAIEALSKKGYHFQYRGDFVTNINDVLCELNGIIDKKIRRAFAKIAFNFFSYFNEENIIFSPSFDKVRNFIINGNNEVPVAIDNEPILADEKNAKNVRLGHIITVSKNDQNCIIAQISLFNSFRYNILLSDSKNDDKKIKVNFGRFFDPIGKKIHEIALTNLVIPSVKLIIPTVKIWTPN